MNVLPKFNRRQFCAALGGFTFSGFVLDSLFAYFQAAAVQEVVQRLEKPYPFSVSKIYLESWHTQIRHQSLRNQFDFLRREFSRIRGQSSAVVLVPFSGIPFVFQHNVFQEANRFQFNVFTQSDVFESSVLEELRLNQQQWNQQRTVSSFVPVVFPLKEQEKQWIICSDPQYQTFSGFLFVNCFSQKKDFQKNDFQKKQEHSKLVDIPQAVVLFDTSCCRWETYSSLQSFPLSMEKKPFSYDRIHFARLLDMTRKNILETNQPIILSEIPPLQWG